MCWPENCNAVGELCAFVAPRIAMLLVGAVAALVLVCLEGCCWGVAEHVLSVSTHSQQRISSTDAIVDQQLHVGDKQALLEFKKGLSSDSAAVLGWDEALEPCTSWKGVTCSSRESGIRVVALQLASHNFTGTISPQLSDLRALSFLNLSANLLTGSVPSEFCSSLAHALTHLDLHQNNLSGPIAPTLSLCTSLVFLDLSWNNLYGTIPPSLSSLSDLQVLQLHHIPLLSGPIPAQLSLLPNLTHLCLGHNNLSGPIPAQLSNLTRLEHLASYENKHTGSIPPQLSLLPSLITLSLFANDFAATSIPSELGNLSSLQFLYLFNSSLSGSLPPSLGRLSKLTSLGLFHNNLSGPIPSSYGNLTRLIFLSLFQNDISGSIPPQLGRLANLQELYLMENSLSGHIPPEIGNLRSLTWLSLHFNQLLGPIPAEIGNLSNLIYFYALANKLQGDLPPQLGKLTNLTQLRLSKNRLFGSLPPSLANCSKLQWLKIENNALSGQIPHDYSSFSRLHTFSLHHNNLSGNVAHMLFTSTSSTLAVLDVAHNFFSGKLPSSWANLQNLRVLKIGYNQFEGNLPFWLWNLTQLQLLDLSNNLFRGSIPGEIRQLQGFKQSPNSSNGKDGETLWDDDVQVAAKGTEISFTYILTLVTSLDLSGNFLNGTIPPELGELASIYNLNLSRNALEGSIPTTLANLMALESLDLSSNNLSGGIPNEFVGMSALSTFNMSYNNLSGQIPEDGQFTTFNNMSYLGNPHLCGFPLGPCSHENSKVPASNKPYEGKIAAIEIAAGVVGAVFIAGAVLWRWRRNLVCIWPHEQGLRLQLLDERLRGVEKELLQEIVEKCSRDQERQDASSETERCVVGRGGMSIVYRISLSNGRVVAVKKIFFPQRCEGKEAIRSFKTESKILGRVRHRNVLRLLGTCSGPDLLACIFDYVPNGSLDEHLHGPMAHIDAAAVSDRRSLQQLDWEKRLKVAIGIAQGLSYLHHDSGFGSILHLDLKPSNVLLDHDFEARISDFGISRMLLERSCTSLTHFRGTLGYVAPGPNLEVTEVVQRAMNRDHWEDTTAFSLLGVKEILESVREEESQPIAPIDFPQPSTVFILNSIQRGIHCEEGTSSNSPSYFSSLFSI